LWLPVLLTGAFTALNIAGYWYYVRTEASLAAAVGNQVLAAAELTASRLDPLLLQESSEESLQPEAIYELNDIMRGAQSAGQFASLFILGPDGRDWLDGDDDSVASERALFVSASGGAFELASSGLPSVSELYRSRGDYFLAACVPVRDEFEHVMAVLVAEAGNQYFVALEELSRGLLIVDVLAALVFATTGVVWWRVQRRLYRAEQSAIRSAQLASMGQMVATVAHELKNPLGIIRNSAERLRAKYGRKDDPTFDFIPEEVDRLDELLRRYLQFARLEIGNIEDVDLGALSEQLRRHLPASLESAPEFAVPHGLMVRADPSALKQVLLNLLLNADAACVQCSKARVSLQAKQDGERVEIEISDTGTGMDKETLRRAAEPFFTTRSDGSGLGIYLAQTLTEKMKGTMSIESRTGEGTTVTIRLPAARSE
jgi:signal transduction histidine kinase